ncbi:MAG: DUF1638 domain-containing protein [Actinobacteria bacterium]|nr:DUF1638 domain-containing protein [Actinomycetota bacterium]
MGEQRVAIVSCGSFKEILESTQGEGLLDGIEILYTEPCLKERPRKLEGLLKQRIEEAKGKADRILVIYGDGCFVDTSDFSRGIDSLIGDTGIYCERIREHSCIEMMLSEDDKEAISDGMKVYWMMPAWVEHKDEVFEEWDLGKRNQTFPQNDTAIVVDSSGFFERLLEEDPEKILDFSDWMGIPLDARPITLDRFKALLLASLERLRED